MKKLMVLIALVLSVNTYAQYTAAIPAVSDKAWHSYTLPYYTAGDDTATNADVIRMGAIMNGRYDVYLKLVYTKVSGTIGSGHVIPRVSPDGTNWEVVSEQASTGYRDSVVTADATTTVIWRFTAEELCGKYLEVYHNQVGTCVTAPVATLYYRKRD